MSWTNELYKVYELAVDPEFAKKGERPMLLPIAHKTQNAQIEINISESGEFLDATLVSKEDAVTVIPVTEASGARSSGIAPMPLADKLVYIAGDYPKYADGKRTDNSLFYAAYMKQLKGWCESEYSDPSIKAICTYLDKSELMEDLIKSGILEIDETTGRLSQKKTAANVVQQDSFVRFIVSGEGGICRTWADRSLFNSFIGFNNSLMSSKTLCYATGQTVPATYKHPSAIRNSGDMAKLISSNDENGFTYRGRFSNKEEALSISYNYSQKIHNALKWLIDSQRITKTDEKGKTVTFDPLQFDSLNLIVWNSALDFVPDIIKSCSEQFPDEVEQYSRKPELAKLFKKKLMGNKGVLERNKVMLMGLDSATKGRLSISVYSELAESEFYSNLEKWHDETMWLRYNGISKRSIFDSCDLILLTNCLYGTEQNGRLETDKKVLKDTILRLIPCVTEGRRLPKDIVRTLYNRASAPLSFDKKYDHTAIIENACAMIRKESIDYRKGEIKMAFDPKCTDRSYLFGCLLAIADKTEEDSYEENEKKRVTNARRLWNAFSSRPYQTWQIIEERLQPYLAKEKWIMVNFTKHTNEIMGKMAPGDFEDNSKLSPMYLIGYHHYNALLWKKNNDNNEEE